MSLLFDPRNELFKKQIELEEILRNTKDELAPVEENIRSEIGFKQYPHIRAELNTQRGELTKQIDATEKSLKVIKNQIKEITEEEEKKNVVIA